MTDLAFGPGTQPLQRRPLRDVVLLGVWDLATLLVAFSVADSFGSGVGGQLARVAVALVGLSVIKGVGGYRRSSWLLERPIAVIRGLLLASTIIAWTSVLVTLAFGFRTDLTHLAILWGALPLAWYAGRQAARLARRTFPERVLIIGSGTAARRVAELWRRARSGIVVGCVDDEVAPDTPADLPVLGGLDQLAELIAQAQVDRVIVAFASRSDHSTLDALRDFPGSLDIVPRFLEFVSPSIRTYTADGLVLMSVPGTLPGRGSALLKRAFDLVAATILLATLSPVMVCIALAILVNSGRPVLFRQRRIGMHGRPFSILKFRTLRPASAWVVSTADEPEPESIAVHVAQTKREAALRATHVGAFLRKSSLDELPQLFNVLVGQMSLVGPRPLSPREDSALVGAHTLRRSVRPGITGLWQVRGRNEIPWETRVDLDYAQVRHWSLWSDVELLVETPRAMLNRRGAQ